MWKSSSESMEMRRAPHAPCARGKRHVVEHRRTAAGSPERFAHIADRLDLVETGHLVANDKPLSQRLVWLAQQVMHDRTDWPTSTHDRQPQESMSKLASVFGSLSVWVNRCCDPSSATAPLAFFSTVG